MLVLNPLMGTLKPQSNGPLYSNSVIGTMADDRWAVTFGSARRVLGGAAAPKGSPLLTAQYPPINSQCINFCAALYVPRIG